MRIVRLIYTLELELSSVMKYPSIIVAFTLVMLCIHPAHADLIVNGSFENPIVPTGGFTLYDGGSNIGGWNVLGADVVVVHTASVQNGITFQAHEGNNWLDLTGQFSDSPSNGVTQNVATVIGTTYNLTFHVGSATDSSIFFASTVDLSIDGGSRLGLRIQLRQTVC